MKKGCYLLWFFFWMLPSLVSAQNKQLELTGTKPQSPSPDTLGVDSNGLGGAGMALLGGSSSLTLNPSGFHLKPNLYQVETGFFLHPTLLNWGIHASIIDSKTNQRIGGGVSYTYFTEAREHDGKIDHLQAHLVKVATSIHWKNTLFFGSTLKYAFLTRPFFPDSHEINLDLGITWQIASNFALAVVGYNLLYDKKGDLPISMGVSLAFGHQLPIQGSFDYVADFSLPDRVGHEFRGGLQYTIVNMLTLRLGYKMDQIRLMPNQSIRHYFHTGLGFAYKKFGFEFAFQQQVGSEGFYANRMIHFSLKIYM